MAELSQQVENRPAALPTRLPTLTGARFIAAGSVFLFHVIFQSFFASQDLSGKYLAIFYHGGWAGVSFFFVLSGFVLTWAVRPTDRVTAFYRRRVFKVYPNHIITAVAALLLVLFVADQAVKPSTVVLNLLLLHSWSPDWAVRTSLNAPAWSLSCELLFYAAFPLLYALIKRIRPERLWAWAGAVAAVAVIGVPVIAAQMPHATTFPVLGLSESQFWFVLQFPPVRALEFVFGMLLARIVITGRRLPVSFGGAVALTVGAYALSGFFPPVFNVVAILFVPLGLVVATGAVADVRSQKTWLSRRTMVFLGEVSFAFYLWHSLVLTYGDTWLGANKVYATPVAIAVIVLLFAVSLALSILLFTLVERPLMRRFASSRRNRPQLHPVSAPEVGPLDEETRRAS